MIIELLGVAALRVSVLLGLALLAARLAPKAAAATRHCILATAVCGALALPALTSVLPRWHAPVPPVTGIASAPQQEVTDVQTAFRIVGGNDGVHSTAPAGAASGTTPAAAIAALWFAGALCTLLVLVVGLARLRSIARASEPLTDGPWAAHLQTMTEREPHLARVRLLRGEHPSLLMTWGLRRPRIVIPACAVSWDEHRVAIVLEHEVEHIRRADWLLQLAAHALCALAWFNPLAWIAAARLRLESERACDDAVIENGIAPADYAEHLLHIARDLARPSAWIPAPAMARTSSLERRIIAMLDTGLTRRPVSRMVRGSIAILGFAATASVASFAAQSQFATVNGTVHDQLGGTIPRVTLTLTHTQSGAKHEVKSGESGSFEFVGLPAGNYTLGVTGMGFKSIERPFQLASGQTLRQEVTLEVGTLQETLMVRDGPPVAGTPQREGRQWTSSSGTSSTCTAQPNSGGIKPPVKIQDRTPVYPASMRGTSTDARVELAATIGIDGTVETIHTVEAPNLTSSSPHRKRCVSGGLPRPC